ncbi:FecR family protein [Parapedobacter koreensis]|uniref:FecR family protein n=1 Tax=Parapedobacter koreensis TaxID=332977 RepID=A0A1H7Q690_9SPHI|nr:FecR family protein [Parapedobacter koreensis]SEL43513.1 FecR family protein [Parapedobacter koreensis]
MDKAHLRYLLQRYLANEINADELSELKRHVQQGDNGTLSDAVDELWQQLDEGLLPEPASSERMYQGILRHPSVATDPPLAPPETPKISQLSRWRWLAGIAALLCAGMLLFRYGRWPNQTAKENHADVADVALPIVPGGNKAILRLADGREINLSSDQAGIVVGDHITYVDGSIVLDDRLLVPSGTQKRKLPEPMSMTIPRGGIYQITLPDGTNVWLNSASTLKYPSQFVGDERVVELEGEAYFEVSEQWLEGAGQTPRKKMPFLVKTKDQIVEVLGTQFNITAYADEPVVKTTLVEGWVQIVNHQSKKTNKLIPGQQSIVRGATTRVSVVDVEQYIAWKNGYFAFADEHISQVMNVIARWYDIEVEYQGDMTNKYFGGTISRFEDFETLLKTIALTGSIRFKIAGRRVIVMT